MIKSLIKNKSVLFGSGLFLYFFLLLLGVLILGLRLGTTSVFGAAFIYRSIIFTIFFGVTLFLYYKRYQSVNYVLVIFLLVFLITNVLAIFIPYGDVNISLTERFMALLYLISIIFTIFAFIEVFPQYIDRTVILVFCILTTFTVIICALYSDIAEFNAIIKAFIASGEDAHFYQIHSFFDNKNSYGLMLFVAIASNIYIYLIYRKKWILIPAIYLFINLIISRSKTGLIITILSLLTIGVYVFIKTLSTHKKRNIIILSSIVAIVIIFSLLVFIEPIYSSSTFLSHLSNYVKEAFIGQGIRSIEDRINNLVLAKEIFLTPRIIIGYGEHICYSFANSCCFRLGYIDNAYIYNLLAGGIFKLALFIYCYYLIFKNLHPLYIDKKVSSLTSLLLYMIVIDILIYGLMENFQILGSNHVSVVFLIFSYSIPILLRRE